MVVASPGEFDGLAVGVVHRDLAGLAGNHAADAPERQFEAGGDLPDGLRLCRRCGEAEFVVVAAGELAF